MSHPWTDVFSILFAIASLFLIFIILLQRGRGGGLAGAFGATGGQSAFGTKAGDIFTRITIGVAVVWVALAAGTGFAMRAESKGRFLPQAVDETGLVPANPPAGAGGNTSPFEAGDQGTKATPATKGAPVTKGATGKDAKTVPATTPPAKSSSSTTPPASTPPASNAKPTPATTK